MKKAHISLNPIPHAAWWSYCDINMDIVIWTSIKLKYVKQMY